MSDGIGRKKRRIINAGLKTREQNEELTRSWLSTFWRFLAKLSHRRHPDGVYFGNPSRKNWNRPI